MNAQIKELMKNETFCKFIANERKQSEIQKYQKRINALTEALKTLENSEPRKLTKKEQKNYKEFFDDIGWSDEEICEIYERFAKNNPITIQNIKLAKMSSGINRLFSAIIG